jgi:DNA-binding transcriptional LysR family regulator
MNTRQLQIFKAVADHKSFAKASVSLFIAQSAVSIAIRKLEENLNLKLFNRNNKSVSLTAEGHVLLRHANKIIDQTNDAKLELAEMGKLEKGEVKLGIPAMLASYYFPKYLVKFNRLHPDLKVSIIDKGTKRIQYLLEQGEIDMGIVNMEETSTSLEEVQIFAEEMLICLPKTHPLAKKSSVSFLEFTKHRLILYKEDYFLREIINRLCEAQQIEPQIHMETNLVQLMKTMVESGVGISVCLRSVIETEKNLCGISFQPKIKMNFGIAWRANSYLSKANKAFLDFLIGELTN